MTGGCERRIALDVRFLVDHAWAKAVADLGETHAARALMAHYLVADGLLRA